MSLQIHATVKDVTGHKVTLAAKAGEVVVPDGWQRDADAINTTTEGVIKSAELQLVFDGDCPLSKGQVVTIEADFAPADEGDEPAAPAPAAAQSQPAKKPRPRRATKKTAAKKAAPAKKASTSK